MPTAYQYARKSRYKRRRNDPDHLGRSVTQQIQWCDNECAANNWPVGDRYVDDSRSASRYATKGREEFERLLEDIDGGRIKTGDIVMVFESSRLQRDLAVYVRLRDACWQHGILWYWSGRLYDLSKREDRLMTGLDALLGEDEVELTRARIMRDKRASALLGRPAGANTYGYKRYYDPETKELDRIEEDPAQAAIVRRIVARVLAGVGILRIAWDLNDESIPSPRGAKWSPYTVRYIATNPAYAGRRVHQGEVLEGVKTAWPAIIFPSDHFRALAILGDPSQRKSRDTAVKHLLSCIAICDVCDAPLTTVEVKGVWFYRCPTPKTKAGPGSHVARRKDRMEQFVLDVLSYRFSRKDARDWLSQDLAQDVRGQRAMEEIAADREHLRQMREQAAARKITADTVAAVEPEILERIRRNETVMRGLRVPTVVTDLVQDSPEAVLEVWDRLALEQQRAVLRAVMEIRVLRIGRGPRPPIEDSVTITFRKPSAQ